MGIFKAAASAAQGALRDQWKEAFCAGEMGSDLLMMRARRMTGPSSANGGSDEVITDGSVIIVGEGECAIVTEGGKIIGIYDQPGEQVFRSSRSKGILGGGLGAFAKDVGQRISFGGDVTIHQRLYYINTRELTGGTICLSGIPLRYRDPGTGLELDAGTDCLGSYTFRISDPQRFFNAAIRSTKGRMRQDLLQQMDSEVHTTLPSVLAQMTREGIRPGELPRYTEKLCSELRRIMSGQWSGLRGIEVYSVALTSLVTSDLSGISALQQTAVLRDPAMAAGHLVQSAGTAMQTAAKTSGPAPLWMAADNPPAADGGWKCSCGHVSSGKFCPECGAKKPEAMISCCHCGWIPGADIRSPKFCPECGNPLPHTRG